MARLPVKSIFAMLAERRVTSQPEPEAINMSDQLAPNSWWWGLAVGSSGRLLGRPDAGRVVEWVCRRRRLKWRHTRLTSRNGADQIRVRSVMTPVGERRSAVWIEVEPAEARHRVVVEV